LLEGQTLEISTRKGDRFRLSPEAAEITDNEVAPPDFNRSPDQCNWFGVKKAPRF